MTTERSDKSLRKIHLKNPGQFWNSLWTDEPRFICTRMTDKKNVRLMHGTAQI